MSYKEQHHQIILKTTFAQTTLKLNLEFEVYFLWHVSVVELTNHFVTSLRQKKSLYEFNSVLKKCSDAWLEVLGGRRLPLFCGFYIPSSSELSHPLVFFLYHRGRDFYSVFPTGKPRSSRTLSFSLWWLYGLGI